MMWGEVLSATSEEPLYILVIIPKEVVKKKLFVQNEKFQAA